METTIEQEHGTLNLAAEMVLEPLSEATRTMLAPPALRESDFLYVWMDDEGRKFLMETRCIDPRTGEVAWFPGVSVGARDVMRRLPEYQWLGAKNAEMRDRYKVAATDVNALVLRHCWPRERIRFYDVVRQVEDDTARMTFDFLIARFMTQSNRASIAARFKLNGEIPPDPPDWKDHPDLPLKSYQKVAVRTVMSQSGALFMDRGTGKTPTVIRRACMDARRHHDATGKMYRVLVVCPPQVRWNWQNEILRFSTERGKVVIVKGGAAKRIKLLVQGITSEDDMAFSFVIIGYDSLVPSIDQFKVVPWDLIVADESHFFKSSSTKRWAAMKEVRENSRSRLILTGTPIGNSPMDLWSQLEFIGEGLSGFTSYKAFRSFYGVYESAGGPGSGVDRLVALKNMPLLQERLARLSFSITKTEAGLDLPDKQYDVWEVEMTKDQARIYEDVATRLAVEIEDRLSKEVNNLTIEHVLTQLLRLAQITSGFVVYDPIVDPDTGETLRARRVVQIDGKNPKVEAVMEALTAEDRDPLGKTIIWCNWREDIHALSARLSAEGIEHGCYYGSTAADERERIIERFNGDPTFRVMICNPQTAGEGLNLIGYDKERPDESLTYTDHMIFFSQNWSGILRGQAEDRAHRIGTRVPVRITDLTVLGTIDEEIRKRVQMKQELATTTLEIREILSNVLRLEDNGS